MKMSDHPSHRGALGSFVRTPSSERSEPGFFAVSGARPIDPAHAVIADAHGRCDAGAFGPYGFHEWRGSACNCGRTDPPDPTMGHHVLTMRNIEYVTVVASALPHGYVLYFEAPTVQAEALEMRHSDCAPTLQELIRLMWEWDQAYRFWNNREPVATTCHRMLDAWGMPAEVRAYLAEQVPAQKVERFLRGDAQARQRPAGWPAMNDAFDEWMTRLCEQAVPLGAIRG